MNDDYLDITRSVLISSPAGSGKTEKLARRYIALLRSGSDVERILAITFTEKAAAEMKERILNILRAEDREMFDRVRDKMPRMRISTIHSFCLKLLKRFSIELGLDPALEVIDSFGADILWSEAIYESLVEDGRTSEKLFYEVIRDKGIKGWNKLYSILWELHAKRPHIELGIRNMESDPCRKLVNEGKNPGEVEKLITLYSKCLCRYRKKKIDRHSLDYNDLELLAYEAISSNPEWQNILYSFDEHTDHILVDEFQDTSSLQWKIIDKLTEEWRSGLGLKRSSGVRPSIFLVGDDKQSIYSFRGANVSIFRNARAHLSEWLGEEYHFVEVKENYRSLPSIVDFVNAVFERLMPKGLLEDWKIEYTPFETARKHGDKGEVELLVLEEKGTIRDSRKGEAAAVVRRMEEFCGSKQIYEGKTSRICNYGDMAILLRSRTHLTVFEEELRKRDVPFVVIKGIGFYHTPEVAILKNLLFFLIDRSDNYSLFNTLRSPIFGLGYESLVEVIRGAGSQSSDTPGLYSSLDSMHPDISATIKSWLRKSGDIPYSLVLEDVLADSGAWRFFHEKQRHMNAKKFIRLIEQYEMRGLSGLEMRENLIKASSSADEQKANVNPEGMNAVRLMTIHASKGLQFPIVFLPCLDEERKSQSSGPVVMDEDDNRLVIGYEDDAGARKTIPLFQKQREKMEEEEKRLFYVGVTRAMDNLCMSGVVKKGKFTGRLAQLMDIFGMDFGHMGGSSGEKGPEGTMVPGLLKVKNISPSADSVPLKPETTPDGASSLSAAQRGRSLPATASLGAGDTLYIHPIDADYRPSLTWHDVTEEIDTVRRKHGDDWVILGRAFHRLFEGLSRSIITPANVEAKVLSILRNEPLPDKKIDALKTIIMSDFQRLSMTDRMMEIISPRENSYSELPFILRKSDKIYRGRIDRVIIEGDIACVYDYKTYPVSAAEIPELKEKYSFQMKIYREAVEHLFALKAKSHLLLTHESMIVEVPA